MASILARRLRFGAVALAACILAAGCTTANDPNRDFDRDGLPDKQEQAGWDVTVTLANGTFTRHVVSSITRPDSDGDGLSDFEEFARGTDPGEIDTDQDGLLDGPDFAGTPELAREFLNWSIVPDPNRSDAFLGEGPFCRDTAALDPTHWDSDSPHGDGIGDGDEVRGWNVTTRGETYAVTSDPCVPDTDGDGLMDGEERAAGTDPRKRDTDEDGVIDSLDADPLTDLAVRVTVSSLTLEATPPSGSTLVIAVNVAGFQDVTERVVQAGENRIAFTVTSNVPDDRDPETGAAPVPVFVRFSMKTSDGNVTALKVTGDPDNPDTLVVSFDIVKLTARLGEGAATAGPVRGAGPDGSVRVVLAREAAA